MRTIEQIKSDMQAQLALESSLSNLNSNSKTAIYNLWMFIVAYAIQVFEGIMDTFKKDVDDTINLQSVGIKSWVRQKSIEFQYDAITPQILTFDANTMTINYSIVDETKRLISQCSVVGLNNKIVLIKLAKNDPPEKLTSTELSAFSSYLNAVSFVGIEYVPYSADPDKLYLDADIYYDGQYSSTIQSAVITAIEDYLYSLQFDSFVKVSKIEDIIQAVPGVNDIVINNLAVRPDATAFANTYYLVKNKQTINRITGTYAGYVVNESSPNDFASTLNFIAI